MEVTKRLAILGHPARLAIFRLLMRRYPDRVAAGELASALDLKASTLSSYLSALTRAGLVTQHRVGTSLRYAIDMTEVRQTFDYLFFDCCRGRPELCAPLAPDFATSHNRDRYRVLFICTGNAARSIFAEAILRSEAPDRFIACSAGTAPRSEVHPIAREVLSQKGHDLADLRPKDIADFQRPDAPRFDFVFTLCNQAANEDCAAWPDQPVTAHWGMPDPAATAGTAGERSLAFREAYGALQNRIRAFAALPLASLDRLSLQRAVDRIGGSDHGVPA